MKTQTLRDVLMGWSESSLFLGSVARDILRSESNPILNARIIPGPCATCGGSGKCPACKGQGDRPVDTEDGLSRYVPKGCKKCKGTGTCPDCPPPFIVPEAVWEAMVLWLMSEGGTHQFTSYNEFRAYWKQNKWTDFESVLAAWEKNASELLSLLGPVRRAKAVTEGVLTTKSGFRDSGTSRVVVVPRDEPGGTDWVEVGYLGDRVLLAILHPEAK